MARCELIFMSDLCSILFETRQTQLNFTQKTFSVVTFARLKCLSTISKGDIYVTVPPITCEIVKIWKARSNATIAE